ncbi:MAG: hypothetical protein Q6373_004810 [Candidatus Sigynarchaeota archaeon]
MQYLPRASRNVMVDPALGSAQGRAHLGYLGLGESNAARKQFDAVLSLDANHLGTILHRRIIPY